MSNKKRGKRGNGEGSIFQRKDGRWVGQILTGYKPDTGKPKYKLIYGKTRKEVAAKLTQALTSIQNGTYTEPNKVTLQQWLHKWMGVFQEDISPNFYARRKDLIRLHINPALGKALLTKLKPSDIQQFYKDLAQNGRVDSSGGLATGTIRHIHNILKPALDKAVKDRLIPYNVMLDVTPPKIVRTREARPLTQEEALKYLNVLWGHRLFAAFLVELTSGLRRGELLGLQWSDLNIIKSDQGEEIATLTISRQVSRIQHNDGTSSLEYAPLKTPKSYRVIMIPVITVNELKLHRERQEQEKLLVGSPYQDENLIFCTPLGGKLDTRHLYRLHCKALEKAKIQHTAFHNLRHSVATLLLEAGENIKSIQELLGHADIETTLNDYGHVLNGMKVVTAEKLNTIFKDVQFNNPKDTQLVSENHTQS